MQIAFAPPWRWKIWSWTIVSQGTSIQFSMRVKCNAIPAEKAAKHRASGSPSKKEPLLPFLYLTASKRQKAGNPAKRSEFGSIQGAPKVWTHTHPRCEGSEGLALDRQGNSLPWVIYQKQFSGLQSRAEGICTGTTFRNGNREIRITQKILYRA